MGETTNAILSYLQGKTPEQIVKTLDNLEHIANRETQLSDLVALADLLDFTKLGEVT